MSLLPPVAPSGLHLRVPQGLSEERGPEEPPPFSPLHPAGRAHLSPDEVPGTKRILLVEDDLDIRGVYEAILAHGGYEVSVTDNGRDAVRMAEEDQPHLVLMDLNLPILDGWAATRQIHARAATEDIPVIAISAGLASDNRPRAAELGFAGYFEKPLPPRGLLDAVRRFFKRIKES